MNIIDIIRSFDGGTALPSLARSYGLEPVELEAILVTVVPAMAQRIEANTLSRGGVADLVAELARPEHAALLHDVAAARQPWAAEAGIRVLNTIFGDKAHSRALAARAAAQSGVSQDLIQKLLPILASLVMAALANGSQRGLQDILKRLPDVFGGGTNPGGGSGRPGPGRASREVGSGERESGGLGDILSRIPGMPDTSGPPHSGGATGSSRGPVAEPSGRPEGHGRPAPGDGMPDYSGGSPLPLPGSSIPGVNAPSSGGSGGGYSRPSRRRDDGERSGPLGELPDVIRRGGIKVDGDPLSGMVRSVLGSLLGFQSKGILGWLIRLIVVRWGWGLLSGILRRALGGR